VESYRRELPFWKIRTIHRTYRRKLVSYGEYGVETPMNRFSDDINAEQYDAARPYFHPLVFERLVRVLGSRFVAALDVACGTGQSTQALAAVSTFVVGLDASARMLHGARHRGVISYVQGCAERLPFPDSAFDIVTVGLGLHWFERDAFFSEASRVLRRRAWLLVYDSGFCGRMRENPAFSDWVTRYRERFPAPQRDDRPTASEVLDRFGLTAILTVSFIARCMTSTSLCSTCRHKATFHSQSRRGSKHLRRCRHGCGARFGRCFPQRAQRSSTTGGACYFRRPADLGGSADG
jgi:SAM-dependent methyltransferase